MKKFIILIGLLAGCNVNIDSTNEVSGNGGSESSGSGGSGGNKITINPPGNVCFQKQGDCKYIDTCENGNVTWKFEPSDVPISHNSCTYYVCKCFDNDCKPIEYLKNGVSCGNNKFCLNGACK